MLSGMAVYTNYVSGGNYVYASRKLTGISSQSGTLWGSYLFATSLAVPQPDNWNGIGVGPSATATVVGSDFVAAYIRGDGTPAQSPYVAVAGNNAGSANGVDAGSLAINTTYLVLFKVAGVGGSGTKAITEWVLTPEQFACWKAAGLDNLTETTTVGTTSNNVWGRAYLTGANAMPVDSNDYIYFRSWVARVETLTFDELRLGLTADSVTPTVAGPTIQVSPSSINVPAGRTQQFTAVARDQDGVLLSPQPTFTWTVSGGGTIDGNGLLTAGTTTGGPYVVTASGDSASGTASLMVTTAPLPGDVNLDGRVNMYDVAAVVNAAGSLIGGANWNAACDFDANGMVDMGDLSTVVNNFGRIRGTPTVTYDGIAYPNPLTLKTGDAVTSTSAWMDTRRHDILNDFTQQVYGTLLPAPTNMTFSTNATTFSNCIRKLITITITGPYGTASFQLRIFLPLTAVTTPAPVFLPIDHRDSSRTDSTNDDPNQSLGYFPVVQSVARGYGMACFWAQQISPDNSTTYRNGMINLFYPAASGLPDNAGRTISAWAWGAMRCMDYFVTDPQIDSSRIAVNGHSRSGKTALWTGACDPRFAYVISNESGCTGAAVARRNAVETIAQINASFAHWFCQNYKSYNNNASALPVDQHELIALMAPRLVYVGSAQSDTESDTKGEFIGLIGAAPVYNLFGLVGTSLVVSDWQPAPDVPRFGTGMGYHIRTGGHDLTLEDWMFYQDYADFSWGTLPR